MADHVEAALNQICRAARVRGLYPAGHPSHANALALAREALDRLFASTEQVAFNVSTRGLSCEGEPLPDADGSLAELGSTLWDQRICGVTIRRGLSEDEIRLLLELFGAPGSAKDVDFVEHLERIGAKCVTVTQFDYERLVPRSGTSDEALGTTEGRETGDIIRLLALSAGGGGLSPEEHQSALAVLDDPSALAAAMLSGIALESAASGAGPGSGAGIGNGDGNGIGTGGDVPLVIGGHHIERPHVAGAALAASIQRLAEMGCEADPSKANEVFAKLAAALRELDPRLLAHAFRADVVTDDAPFDALRESAGNLSMDELLELVRRHPQAVASEPSAVYRRLLRRVAPTGDRLVQLAPALKAALLDDGMSENVFTNTLGQALKEAVAERSEETDSLASGAAAAGLAHTSEALRAARRQEIEPLLKRAADTDDWTCRATTCIELLQLPGHCEQHPKTLEKLGESLQRTPPSQRNALSMRALELLAALTGPTSNLSSGSRAVAMSVLAEVSDNSTLDGLRRSLADAQGDDFTRIVRALVMAGERGRQVLLELLLRAATADNARLAAVVSALVDVEAEELVADTGLHNVVLDPACRNVRGIIAALAGKGGPIAARHLIAVLRDGEFGLRSDVVRAAGESGPSLSKVLVVALDDPDEEIRCAAAAGLGASGDEYAVPPLLRHLRPFALLDPHQRLRVTVARALGELGSKEAVTLLAEVLRRTSWLRRSECDGLRAAAADSLLAIGSRRALQTVAERASGERCPAIQADAAAAAARLQEMDSGAPQREEEAAHAV